MSEHDPLERRVLDHWAQARRIADFPRIRAILNDYPDQVARRGNTIVADRVTLTQLADEYRQLTAGVETAVARMPDGARKCRAQVIWDQVGHVFDLGQGRALLAFSPAHLHMALGRMSTLWLELEGLVAQVM